MLDYFVCSHPVDPEMKIHSLSSPIVGDHKPGLSGFDLQHRVHPRKKTKARDVNPYRIVPGVPSLPGCDALLLDWPEVSEIRLTSGSCTGNFLGTAL